ncbi:tyrosine-type recombinase/integrase [uncultured Desulfobacter sp.]|uniref:tyrosine-type recombinase/integrase n=1 Tax=uncultured Desulfobacter sp. TaxID=240139 RepID=UPI0029F47358|nr:tyrosine-type recombinase/integrase [uncultured Desulfobacter sp.]
MNDNPFKPYIDQFRLALKVRNLTGKTIGQICWKLGRFTAWLMENQVLSVDAITKDAVRSYQVELYQAINARGRQNGVAYQNAMMSAVRQFTRFLYERDFIVSDPARDIRYAKIPKSLPKGILSPAEARKILHAPDITSVIGYRDRVILEVLYTSGIRKEELNHLTLADVDCHDGFLRIDNGKGQKDRIVPLGRIACRYLENYITSVRPELIRDPYNTHLFLSLRGNRLSKNVVWALVKKYAKKAKIRKNVHPHTFRHSCATGMLKNKADLNTIRKLLGHTSLNTTQIYTHLNITELKAVHKQCHPREKDRE